MQLNHLLKIFAIKFFFSLPVSELLFIVSNLLLETLLWTHELSQHAKVIIRVIFVETLHLLKQLRLLSHLGQVVDGLVKDRNVVRLLYSLITFENGCCLDHHRVSDFSQMLSETLLCRSARDYRIWVHRLRFIYKYLAIRFFLIFTNSFCLKRQWIRFIRGLVEKSAHMALEVI